VREVFHVSLVHPVHKERDLRWGASSENLAILNPLIRASSDTMIGFPLSGRLQQVLVAQSPVAGHVHITPSLVVPTGTREAALEISYESHLPAAD
jgi:hypothetical protein